MEEPPEEDRCRDDEEAKCLVADGGLALSIAALIFGYLFAIGLDAGFDDGSALPVSAHTRDGSQRISIGAEAIRVISC